METLDPRYRKILEEISALRDHLDRLEYETVHFLREYGVTWEMIGESHDPPITRQNAAKRFARVRRRRSRGDTTGDS